jgi:NADPH:quinone reductase-like Zn-dependent oxidoreductase
MLYKSVEVTKRGGPEALRIVQNELRPPATGEIRVRILATPVCRDDVAARVGNRPFLPKIPFVPGYSTLGVVDALGQGVNRFGVGERVAALTQFGGYSEYIYLDEKQAVRVPDDLDPAEAAVLILNYLVAYQTLHRVAAVSAGDSALIIGASGGVGTALLQLGRIADLEMYGLASRSKHAALSDLGATLIDYRAEDFVEVIRQAHPEGIDFVFNGMGEEYISRGMAVLRRGGVLIHYGGPESFSSFLLLVAKLILYNVWPNGKTIKGYGTHRLGVELFEPDWTTLFKLLSERKIRPVIAATFPLLEAAKANAMLEKGQVAGNIVLLAPELL